MLFDVAMRKARKAIEQTYDRKCTVFEYKSVKDDDNITRKKEVAVLTDIPCRISYKSITNTNVSNGVAQQSIVTKLFISPDIEIKSGSKIVVTKGDLVETYQRSGMPARYDTHQEIILTNFERWA